MQETEEEKDFATPGQVLGKASDLKAGKGTYVAPHNNTMYASLTGRRSIISSSPDSPDQRPTVEVTGHKAHGAVPEPGSVVIARVTKVMARMASADIMCVGPKSVREKFTGNKMLEQPRLTKWICTRPFALVISLEL
uniref:Exosome complex component N-terminal domain-containing protein n=1 Tax=Davidia involucrata TaxID=16924 RepID=A0A5B6YNY9_DAVIN